MLELTIQELAERLGCSPKALANKAGAQAWPYREGEKKGRHATRYYPLFTLPKPLQLELILRADDRQLLELSVKALGGDVVLDDEVAATLAVRVDRMMERGGVKKAAPRALSAPQAGDPAQVGLVAARVARPLDGPVGAKEGQDSKAPAGSELAPLPWEDLGRIPTPAPLQKHNPTPEAGPGLTDVERRRMAMEKQSWLNWFETQKKNRITNQEIVLMLEQKRQAGVNVPSLRSLQVWGQKQATLGVAALLDRRVNSGRKPTIGPELEDRLIALMVFCPDARAGHLARTAGRELGVTLSERTLRDWMAKQEKDINRRLFAFLRNPDKAKRLLPYPGQAEGWRRLGFLDRVEWDGSPADVHCVDGRFTVMAAIDVATRQVQVVLGPSSSTEATKLLLRQLLLAWGKPQSFRGDQGSEFINKDMEWIFASLGILNSPAMPYSGDQKPFVERFFGTLTRSLFEVVPGFSGHNVAQAQDIRARKRFDQRRALETQDEATQAKEFYKTQLTRQQLYELIQQELAVYHEERHSGLGKSPNQRLEDLLPKAQIFKPDLRELDILLSEQRDGSVTAKGISFRTLGESRNYQCPEYVDHIGAKVRIFVDPNPHQIHVFSTEGRYLFTAFDRAISAEQAIAMREAVLAQISTKLGYYAALIERAGYEEKNPFTETLKQRAVVGLERHDQLVGRIHQQSTTEQTSELRLAVLAKEEFEKGEQAEAQRQQAWEGLAEPEPPQGRAALKPVQRKEDQYLTGYRRLEAQIERGEALSAEDLDFMDRLEQTPAVRDYKHQQQEQQL